MKRLFLALAASAAILGAAEAQTYSQYNPYSGNSYTVTPTPGGGARVQGFNYNTGSMWNQNIDRRGNANGFDSRGNYWNYNSGTGTYHNFGTGRVCTGTGAARTCY